MNYHPFGTIDLKYYRRQMNWVSYVAICLLQPQNILLTSARPLGDIRIVDFGLSRRMDNITEVREILGTPEYVGESRIQLTNTRMHPISCVLWLTWAFLFQPQRSWTMNPLVLRQTCGECAASLVCWRMQTCDLQKYIEMNLWVFTKLIYSEFVSNLRLLPSSLTGVLGSWSMSCWPGSPPSWVMTSKRHFSTSLKST